MVVTPRALTAAERLDWLRLIRSENIGPRTFFHLLNHFESAAAALEAAPELARRGGRKRPIRITPREKAETELAALTDAGGRLIACGASPNTPAHWRRLPIRHRSSRSSATRI